MKAMVCELCGGNKFVKQDGYFVCQHCNTQYTVEEAKKLMVEGTVRIDKSEETQKLLLLARRAREYNNRENAEKYYSEVLKEEPNNWEASFFQVYYRAMQCSIAGIFEAAISVSNNIESTVKLITIITDEKEKAKSLDTVITYLQSMVSALSSAAKNHLRNYFMDNGAFNECSYRISALKRIYALLEIALKKYFPSDIKSIVKVQILYYNYITSNKKFLKKQFRTSETTRLLYEIRSIDPSFIPLND